MKLVGKEECYWPLWCQTVFNMRSEIESRLTVADYELIARTPGLVNCHVSRGSLVNEAVKVGKWVVPGLFDVHGWPDNAT